jgi:CubicO group peptidase (beta-lactamase class C family)
MGLEKIEALLDAAVATNAVAGIVVGVTTRDGTILRSAKGRVAADGEAVMTPYNIFWIASMTKAITSIAAMGLVEKGVIRTDEPIARILPELASPQVLEGFDEAGKPKLRPARGPITLGQLLSHSSGFPEHVWHADTLRYLSATGTPPTSTAKRAALALPLVGDPGTVWQYGISHDWVGQFIERVSGQMIDAYLRDHVFAPLGMKDSGYELAPGQLARMATAHRREPDGRLTPFERGPVQGREYWPGGGSLNSTLEDYLAFARMILNEGLVEGRQFLKPETVRRLPENQTGTLSVSKLKPTLPELSNAADFLPGIRKGWGLGFMVNFEDVPGARKAGSLAWAGLSNCYYWIDPASGVAGVLLTQILPFADKAVLDVFDRFERAVYAAL